MEKLLLSATKGKLGLCEGMIHEVVAHFYGDLEQSDLIRELVILKMS